MVVTVDRGDWQCRRDRDRGRGFLGRFLTASSGFEVGGIVVIGWTGKTLLFGGAPDVDSAPEPQALDVSCSSNDDPALIGIEFSEAWPLREEWEMLFKSTVADREWLGTIRSDGFTSNEGRPLLIGSGADQLSKNASIEGGATTAGLEPPPLVLAPFRLGPPSTIASRDGKDPLASAVGEDTISPQSSSSSSSLEPAVSGGCARGDVGDMMGDINGWLIETGRLTGCSGNGLKGWIGVMEDGRFSLADGFVGGAGEATLIDSLLKDSTLGLISEGQDSETGG